jgi:[citrate (pro-3S)-lyase] ligase|tara:strand:- start:139 stop:1713 length:1575 start_codon:yes stop_codon:yes gene_type:complete
MILRKNLKNQSKLSAAKRWESLIIEEINNESLSNYNLPLLKGVKKYVEDKGGVFLLVDRPKFPNSNFSKNEKRIIFSTNNKRILKFLYNIRLIDKSFFIKLTRNNMNVNLLGCPNKKLRKNYLVNEDFENSFIRVENGYRLDAKKKGAIQNFKSIYLFGSSLVYSVGCENWQTLPLLLESRINNSEFQAFNRGVVGTDVINSCFAILDTQISRGDLIILYGLNPISEKEKIEIKKETNLLDLTEIFTHPHSYGNVFYDLNHLTPEGNKVVAKLIANELQNNFQKRIIITEDSFSVKENDIFLKVAQCRFRAALRYIDEAFPHYINILKSKYRPGNNGIAAMNCNPFTLGHKHLILTASKMVDTLYVFVVEEDKSFFKFKERFEMVKKGVNDIANVVVVGSGKYLVSSMTFPDYFTKEEGVNPDMNVSYDFEIFIYYIAPTLKLRTRFIGNEPFCMTTRIHHDRMKETLPPKGIAVIEIDRLENEFGPISASKVRALIKNKEFDKLSSFLPITTTDYLKKYDYLN